MRAFLVGLLLALPLGAEKVSFDVDDRFSVEFPEGWKKAKPPQAGVVVHRELEGGEAAFSISTLLVAPRQAADMEATLQSFVQVYKKSGMTVKGDPKGKESIVDGKKALVATVPIELKHEGQLIAMTMFLVLVECRERLVVMQATLPDNGTNEQREDCRKIIGSFEEKQAGEEEESEEEEENEEAQEDEKEDE